MILKLRNISAILYPVTDPSGVRFSLAGNILHLDKPRSVLEQYFAQTLPVCALRTDSAFTIFSCITQAVSLAPLPLASEVLNELGRNPHKKVWQVSSHLSIWAGR